MWRLNYLILLAVSTPSLFALQTGYLVDEGYLAFSGGELKNLSLSVTGELEVAPALTEVSALGEPVIWAAVPDGDGNLILGTGNSGKVLRLDAEGTLDPVFEPDSVLSRAVAIGEDGSIYIGTSPNGAIYRIAPDRARPEVFYDPTEVYLWDMQIHENALWVTTGFEAKLLRVPLEAPEEAEVWFQSPQDHLTVLLRDRDRWVVGSSSTGVVYSVTDKDKAFALYNSQQKEIRSLQVSENGTLLVSTYSEAGSDNTSSSGDSLPPLVVTASSEKRSGKSSGSPRKGSGYLLRLDDNGFATPLWTSSSEGAFALARQGADSWLVGSNDSGKLYYYTSRSDWGLLHQMPKGGEVGSIVPAIDGTGGFFIITSNPGVIYRLGGLSEDDSEYLSEIKDARQPVRWGAFEPNLSRQGDLSVATRSGNTDEPDGTWSEWQELEASTIVSPSARYLQYRLTFPSGSDARFIRARIFYQLPNVAPVVSSIKVLGFGADIRSVQGTPNMIDFSAAFKSDTLSMFEEGGGERLKLQKRGELTLRTAVWQAGDPNGDHLSYSIFLRKAQETAWTVLARGLEDPAFILNAAGMTSGYYQIKVIASDLPGNDPADALTGEGISSLILIDATPPEVVVDTSKSSAESLTFVVKSDVSRLIAAQVSVDGAIPNALRPVDGIFDSREEVFLVDRPSSLTEGGDVVFEVLDESGNQTAFTARFTP